MGAMINITLFQIFHFTLHIIINLAKALVVWGYFNPRPKGRGNLIN